MAKDLGLTPADGGAMAGYLGMAWGVSAFVMGYLADKVGRRAVLAPAILVFSLMSAFSGMAGTVMGLVLVRVIMGIAEGPVASTGVAVAVGEHDTVDTLLARADAALYVAKEQGRNRVVGD